MGFAQKLGLPMKELVVAPMVDQSDLAFRMLCRKYGAKLCYTPMLHSKVFLNSKEYREEKFTTCPEDRPLIAQFCGNDKDVLLEAAKMVQDQCDAIDLNLGCPQNIARKGRYGAFLLDEQETVLEIVSHLAKNLDVPVTCKIRIFDDVDETIRYAQKMEAAGCSLLCVHGRTKECKNVLSGSADWGAIARIKQAVSIPVIANGNIGTYDEIDRCLEATGADGVMSAEAILENPLLVMRQPESAKVPSPTEIALEYLEFAEKYNERFKIIRGHMFRFLHGQLLAHPVHRQRLHKVRHSDSMAKTVEILRELDAMHANKECDIIRCQLQNGDAYGSYYDRHINRNSAFFDVCPDTGEKQVIGVSEIDREKVRKERLERKKRKAQGRTAMQERKKQHKEAHLRGLERMKRKKEAIMKKRQEMEKQQQQQKE